MNDLQGQCSKCDRADLALTVVSGLEALDSYDPNRYIVDYHLNDMLGRVCAGSDKPPLRVVEE